MSLQLIPTAEPFYMPGGSTGCLLVHGFTGSPKEMRLLGEHLHAQNYTVIGIRLAGHATDIKNMLHQSWDDWYYSVLDGYHLMKSNLSKLFVIGLSMGSALSFLLAAENPVNGIIGLSTPYKLPPDPRLPFLKFIQRFYRFVPKEEADWHEASFAKGHVEYNAYPVHAIVELQKLLHSMREQLPSVQAPALLIHSKDDTSVLPKNAEMVYKNLRSQDKRLIWIEDSGHNIVCDKKREEVFQFITEFIQNH